MPGIEWTDFSGGMVSDINEIVAAGNTFKTMQNVDCWSELGIAKPLTGLGFLDNFPAGKSYDHHVIFPAHGVKDFAIIAMTDGTIYSYDPTAGTEFVSIGSSTAGLKMTYANDRVYVFYRNMTAPTSGNTVRKVIEYDYVAGTFSIADLSLAEQFLVNSTNVIANDFVSDINYKWQVKITSGNESDAAESFGKDVFGLAEDTEDGYILIQESSVVKLRVYYSFINQSTVGMLTPQFLFEIKDITVKSYVPLWHSFGAVIDGGDQKQLNVPYDIGGNDSSSALTQLCDLHINSSIDYLDTGNKVKIAGIEYTIDTITDNAGSTQYEILFTTNLPDVITEVVWEWELGWEGGAGVKTFFVPVQIDYANLTSVQSDENRPESKFTSGTGNLIASLGNYLVTANPYFPDIYSTGEDLDKKGWLCWSWITGEGLYALSLLPDVQLITSTGFSSVIIEMFSFKEDVLVFHKGGLVRFTLENGLPFPFDHDNHGIDDAYNYYKDNFRLFIYSNEKVKMAVFTRRNIEQGEFQFVELSRGIASLVDGNVDARFGYMPDDNLLLLNDLNGNIDDYICSLRNQKPVWIKWTNTAGVAGATAVFEGSFVLNGKVYIIGSDTATYRIYEEKTSWLQNLIVETYNIYMPMGNDYIKKIEVVYQQTAGQFVFEVYGDDVQIYTEVIGTVKTTPGIYEIKLPRTSTTRIEKLRWKLTRATVSEDNFKLLGVFINRDDYGKETKGGY